MILIEVNNILAESNWKWFNLCWRQDVVCCDINLVLAQWSNFTIFL